MPANGNFASYLQRMIIRKARPEDAAPVAACLLLAMQKIEYRFIGRKDSAAAKAFMTHFVQRENNPYSYQHCWAAQKGRDVLAAVNVYEGASLDALRRPVLGTLPKTIRQQDQARG